MSFDLKQYLTSRRDIVIEAYGNLRKEKYFNGISLRDFMLQVMNKMGVSTNDLETADKALPNIVGLVYVENSQVSGKDVAIDRMIKKYYDKSKEAIWKD